MSGCCVKLLFVNTFLSCLHSLRDQWIWLVDLGCLFSSVPGLECEKAERGHLHILNVRVKSNFRFHLMPVRCWLIMFIFAQSMARVNRNDDMSHPCRTPDFTVNMVIEFPTLQEKFL